MRVVKQDKQTARKIAMKGEEGRGGEIQGNINLRRQRRQNTCQKDRERREEGRREDTRRLKNGRQLKDQSALSKMKMQVTGEKRKGRRWTKRKGTKSQKVKETGGKTRTIN